MLAFYLFTFIREKMSGSSQRNPYFSQSKGPTTKNERPKVRDKRRSSSSLNSEDENYEMLKMGVQKGKEESKAKNSSVPKSHKSSKGLTNFIPVCCQ